MSLADRQNREQTYSKEYLLHHTPSRKDGIDINKENQLRRRAQIFVKKLGHELKLNDWVQQTALIFFERFFARRSFLPTKNDSLLLVAAALFLAAKATDNPRPIAAVADAYFRTRTSKPDELASYQRNPERKIAELGLVDFLLTAERAILFTLDFNVKAELPSNSFTKPLYLEQFGIYSFSQEKKEGPDELTFEQQSAVSQKAVTFCNDSCRTTLILQYTHQQAAAICLRYAASVVNVQLKTPQIVPQEVIDAMPNNTEDEKKAREKVKEQRKLLIEYQITDDQYNDYVDQLTDALYKKMTPPGAAADGAAAAAPTAAATAAQQQNGVAAPAGSGAAAAAAAAGPRAAAAAQQQPQRPGTAAAAAGPAAPSTTTTTSAAAQPYPVPLPRPASLPPRGADAPQQQQQQQQQPTSSYQTSTHSGQQGSLLSKRASSAAEEGEITAAAASDASEEVGGGRVPPQPAVGGQHHTTHQPASAATSAPAPHPRVGPSSLNPVAQAERSPRHHGTKRSAEPADYDSARDAKSLRVA